MENEKLIALRTMNCLEVLKIYPDLVREVAAIRAAEVVLEKYTTHPEIKKRALQCIKNTVVQRIEKGLPLPTITIRKSKLEDSQPEFDYERF